MDDYKRCGSKFVGVGGIGCSCCDNGLSKKGKSKITKNLFSKLRRSALKRETRDEIEEGIKDWEERYDETVEYLIEGFDLT